MMWGVGWGGVGWGVDDAASHKETIFLCSWGLASSFHKAVPWQTQNGWRTSTRATLRVYRIHFEDKSFLKSFSSFKILNILKIYQKRFIFKECAAQWCRIAASGVAATACCTMVQARLSRAQGRDSFAGVFRSPNGSDRRSCRTTCDVPRRGR